LKKLQVTSDAGQNRLYFTIAGRINKKELNSFYTEVRFCVEALKPGFSVISDFSDCQLVFLNIIPTFRNIMRYLVTNMVGEIIGVMNKNSLFFKQVQLASMFQGYRPIYASSREEAEAMLANAVPRNGIRFSLHRKAIDYLGDNIEGNGYIQNISISGCSVKHVSALPAVDEEIQITTTFTAQDNMQDSFTIKGRIVRVEDNGFAVEFTDFDNTRKEQLWKYLVDESQCDIGQVGEILP